MASNHEAGRGNDDQVITETIDTVVIGGGQTGLAVGYELASRGVEFTILDASLRVGDAWRNRWDSLLLFTPAWMNGLPGMEFPAPKAESVGKDQVADYLESYAVAMNLPIRSGVRVQHVGRQGSAFVVSGAGFRISARNVVVAMADYQVPRVPDFAPDLSPDIVQIHSSQYRNPSQLQEGRTLVVGLGNSGADIGLEVSRSHETVISGTESGHVPFRLESRFGKSIGVKLVRFAAVRVLNTATVIGRRARPKMITKAAPLVRVKPKDLAAAGVARVPRVTGVKDGYPVLADGTVLEVENVIWCTGFRHGFSWIDLPVFEDSGSPRHQRGIVEDEPGLYFVGLYFLHALWSETITGVQTDARHVADHLAGRYAGQGTRSGPRPR